MQIFELSDETIAQGDTVTFEYSFVDENNEKINLENFEVFYILSAYGYENVNQLTLSMRKVDENTCSVTLYTEDTKNLIGTYTVKIVLRYGDSQYKKARGILNVLLDTSEVTT